MRKFLVPAAVVIASLLFGLLVAEGALRLLGIGYPLFTRPDAWTGFSLRPGAAGWQRDEGEAFVRVSSAGLRDREHDLQPAPDVVRIAVLGDSYAEARQVDIEKTFWAVMEKELGACPSLGGKKVEVLNFGVSGFGTAQELLLMPRVWRFRPDAVLLAFTTGNDVRNNSYALEGNPDKPYFYFEGGELRPDYSFRDGASYASQTRPFSRAMQWLVSRSRVLQVVNRARSALRRRDADVAPAQAGTPGGEAGLDLEVYAPPKNPAWEDAWKVTEELLKMMHRDVAGHGAKFAVVTLSNGIQVHPNGEVRQELQQSLAIPDLFEPDRRVAQIGVRDGFTVFMLGEVMQRMADQSKAFYHGFPNTRLGEGHWNENGHREAGQLIAKVLCGEGFVQK